MMTFSFSFISWHPIHSKAKFLPHPHLFGELFFIQYEAIDSYYIQ